MLANQVNDGFSSVIELPDDYWIFEDEGRSYKVLISYEEIDEMDIIDYTVRDMSCFFSEKDSPEDFQPSIVAFLEQFSTINIRWNNAFEQMTEDIIAFGAGFQEFWLTRCSFPPSSTLDERTPIASALQCLVRCYNAFEVSLNWPFRYMEEYLANHNHIRLRETESDFRGLGFYPSIDVWRLPHDHDLPEERNVTRTPLGRLWTDTIQIAQRILFRGRATDWPLVFFTLCILTLARGCLDGRWTNALRIAYNTLKGSLDDLCRIFLHCTGDLHPLNPNFDLEWFTLMVGGEEPLVDYYREMNKMWANSAGVRYEEEYETFEGFCRNLDIFVHGMVL